MLRHDIWRSARDHLTISDLNILLLWMGYCGTWVKHSTAALTMNAYDLADWITFLPSLGEGSPFVGRLHFLGSLALIIVLTTAWAVGSQRRRWALVLSALGLLMMLPGYPFILWYRTDLQVQAQIGLWVATLGISLLVGWLRDISWVPALHALAAASGVFLSTWSIIAVLSVISEFYGQTVPIGWGWFAMNAGLLSVLVVSCIQCIRDVTRP